MSKKKTKKPDFDKYALEDYTKLQVQNEEFQLYRTFKSFPKSKLRNTDNTSL